jgi:ribosome-associated protein
LSKLGKPRTSKGLALLCAKVADSKLSRDIIVMNLTQIETSPTDYFMICTCDSDVQVEAVVNAIMRTAKDLGLSKPSIEGLESKQWVLIDFFDVVCHIMLQQTRNYYKLEKLWGDAIFMRLNDTGELRALKKEDLLSVIREKVLD